MPFSESEKPIKPIGKLDILGSRDHHQKHMQIHSGRDRHRDQVGQVGHPERGAATRRTAATRRHPGRDRRRRPVGDRLAADPPFSHQTLRLALAASRSGGRVPPLPLTPTCLK